MFGTRSRRQATVSVAEQAWDHLVEAIEAAGDAARAVTSQTTSLADEAQGRLGSATREARRRAEAARDALAGRRPPLPWTWILGATVVGLAAGWLAAASASRAVAVAELAEPEEQPAPLEPTSGLPS